MSEVPSISRVARNMRIYRKRKRRDLQCVTVRVSAVDRKTLVSKGYLDPAQESDRAAVTTAVEAYLSNRLFEEAS